MSIVFRALNCISFLAVVALIAIFHYYAEDAALDAGAVLDYSKIANLRVYDGTHTVAIGVSADEITKKLRESGFGECEKGVEANLNVLRPRIFCRRGNILTVKSFVPFADYVFELNQKTHRVRGIRSAGEQVDEARLPPSVSSAANLDENGEVRERIRFDLMLGKEIDPDSNAVKFFIWVEDRRFFQHAGNDWPGIARAIYRLPFYFLADDQSFQGASTITEQVAKLIEVGEGNRLLRRIKSLFVAESIERRLSKSQILELWLNLTVMGLERPNVGTAGRRIGQRQESVRGFKTAARVLFDKRLDECTPTQLATLAVLPRAPEIFPSLKNGNVLDVSGNKNHRKLDGRRKKALETYAAELEKSGRREDAARYRAAIDKPVQFAFNEDDLMGDESLTSFVERELKAQPGVLRQHLGGASPNPSVTHIDLVTTIDRDFQRALSLMLEGELPGIKRQLVKLTGSGTPGNPKKGAAGRFSFEVQADVVALSVENGALRAFSSLKTRNKLVIPNRSNVNPPSFVGSTAKSLITAYGFSEGVVTPHTVIRPDDCVAPNGFRFEGPADNRAQPFSNHLIVSRNAPFICVGNKLGIDNVLAKWRELFPGCKIPGPGFVPDPYEIVRGVNRPEAELPPTALAEAYTALAGKGNQQFLRVIESVHINGKQIPLTAPSGRQVFKPEAAALTASLLRAGTVGLTNWQPTDNFDLALKTGSTSNSYIVILFSPKLVVLVRYLVVPAEKLDEKAALAFSEEVSKRFQGVFAGKLVKPFSDSILKVIKAKRIGWLRGTFMHENIVSLRIDPSRECVTGDSSGVTAEYIRGTEPKPCPFEPEEPEDSGQ